MLCRSSRVKLMFREHPNRFDVYTRNYMQNFPRQPVLINVKKPIFHASVRSVLSYIRAILRRAFTCSCFFLKQLQPRIKFLLELQNAKYINYHFSPSTMLANFTMPIFNAESRGFTSFNVAQPPIASEGNFLILYKATIDVKNKIRCVLQGSSLIEISVLDIVFVKSISIHGGLKPFR